MTPTTEILRSPESAPPQPGLSAPVSHAPPTALRAFLVYAIEAFPPDLALCALRLASKLPDEQVTDLLHLLRAVDDRAIARAVEDEHRIWQQVLAQVPGVAPALHAVRAQLQGVVMPPGAESECPAGQEP